MLDKNPIKSKKFLAYLVSDIGWKIIIMYMLMHLQSKLSVQELTLLMTIVITSGVIQIGYILGQVALDKYISAAVEILDNDEKDKKQNVSENK
jgi:hypothetical protein